MIWLADRLVGRPASAVALLLAATTLAAIHLPRLTFDDDYRRVFRGDAPAFARAEAIAADFGADDNEVVVLVEGDVLAPAALVGLHRAHEDLAWLDEVDDVVSIVSGRPSAALQPTAPDEISSDPAVRGRLLSDEGRATVLLVRLVDEPRDVDTLAPLLDRIRSTAETALAATGLGVRLTGIPVLRAEVVRSIQGDQIRFNVVGGLLVSGLALLIFRRFAAVVLVGLPAIIGVTWLVGLMGAAGAPFDVVNNVTPQIVLVIAFTDAVHLVHRFHELRRTGLERRDAVRRALQDVGPACALTSLTTGVGFASLLLAPFPILQGLGFWCAVGVALAFAAVIVTTPLLACTRLGDLSRRDADHAPAGRARLLEAFVDGVLARRRPIATVAIAGTLVMGGAFLALSPDYRYSEYLPEDSESSRTLRRHEALFGGAFPVHAVVEWSGAPPAGLGDAIADVEGVLASEAVLAPPTSILTLLSSFDRDVAADRDRLALLPLLPPELSRRFIRVDRGRAIVTARTADRGARVLAPVVDRVSQRLDELGARHPGVRLSVSGLVVVASQASVRMIRTLATSLLAAAVVIVITLAIAFRSGALALISVVPNAFPLVGLAGFLVITGRPLQFTSVAVFTICLGIAVDDTIHVLTAFRRERRATSDASQALRQALLSVGPALLATTLILMAGFATLLVSHVPLIRLFGFLSSLTFALALVGDLVLLPALLSVAAAGGWLSEPVARAGEHAQPEPS